MHVSTGTRTHVLKSYRKKRVFVFQCRDLKRCRLLFRCQERTPVDGSQTRPPGAPVHITSVTKTRSGRGLRQVPPLR